MFTNRRSLFWIASIVITSLFVLVIVAATSSAPIAAAQSEDLASRVSTASKPLQSDAKNGLLLSGPEACATLPRLDGQSWDYDPTYLPLHLHPDYPALVTYADTPPGTQVYPCSITVGTAKVMRFATSDDSLDAQYLKLLNYAFYYSVGPIDALTSGIHDWCYMSDNFVESGFLSGQPPNYPPQDDGSRNNIAPPYVSCNKDHRPAGDPSINPCATFVSSVYRAMGYSNYGPYSTAGNLLNLVKFYYYVPAYDMALNAKTVNAQWQPITINPVGGTPYDLLFDPFNRYYHLVKVQPGNQGTGQYTYQNLPTDLKPGDMVITIDSSQNPTQTHISLFVGWGPNPGNVLTYSRPVALTRAYASGLIPYVMDRGKRTKGTYYTEDYDYRGPRPFVYDLARIKGGGPLSPGQYYEFWIAGLQAQGTVNTSISNHIEITSSRPMVQLRVAQRDPDTSTSTTVAMVNAASPTANATLSATSFWDLWNEILNIILNALSHYEYDQRAEPGKTTCYQAHALDAEGHDLGYSNEVCLTNPPESTYPYGIESVSTIPITPSYKNLPTLFDNSTNAWAIVNYVAGEPVSVTLEFSERTTLSGFSIGLGGDANLPNAYSLSAVAAESLDELNAGTGATYQTIVQDVPAPALEHVNVSFPHNYTARFFRFVAVRNEYSRHVHISELTPGLVTGTVGSSISGILFANSHDPDNALANAYVQACTVGGVCYIATTDNAGHYAVRGLKAGSYLVTAFPPAGSTLLHERIGPLELSDDESLTDQDLVLMAPATPPTGTTITSRSTTSTGLPIVYWAEPLVLSTNGCVNATATYSISLEGITRRSGSLAEGPSGTYTTTIEPLTPMHGEAHVAITLNCPNSTITTVQFDMYIDPSGTVTTVDGVPIAGATVILYRSENRHGPFEAVPDGSALMSPMNRRNPDNTDANGHYGWDVLAGYYKVRAEKLGCTSPDDPDQPYVESAALSIPPAVTDLALQLDCPDSVPPTITATASPLPNVGGWNSQDVTLTLIANDEAEGSGVQDITYSATGAQAIAPTTVPGNTASFLISTEGSTTVTYGATDNASNSSAPQTLTVQLDQTAPAISIASPLAQAYTHTMSLNLAWTVDDPLSSAGESSGQLDGTAVNNGQTLDLLALSLGAHTLTVSASDLAGNAGQQSVTFTVTASIDSLSALAQQACTSGAITRHEACVALKATLRVAQELIQHGKYALARQVLRAFNVELLAIWRGHGMDQATYERLKAEALFVINALPQ